MFFEIFLLLFIQIFSSDAVQTINKGEKCNEIRISFCSDSVEENQETSTIKRTLTIKKSSSFKKTHTTKTTPVINYTRKSNSTEPQNLNSFPQYKDDEINASSVYYTQKNNTKTVYTDKDIQIIVKGRKRKRKSAHGAFTYENGPTGVRNWHKIYPECGGRHQSPVNINNNNLEKVNLEELQWSRQYFQYPELLTITNNGHSVVLRAKFEENSTPLLSGGPLEEQYVLDQVHFHWGANDDEGSEHTIDQQAFCMEMHAVHHKSDLRFEDALKEPDGLAVVAYIFEIDRENRALTYITVFFEQLEQINNEVQMSVVFRLSDLIVPFVKDYVTYSGSLTTPPCSESVIWLMAPKTNNADSGQIQKFRDLFKNTGMKRNFRPTQQLNDRALYLVTDL